MVKSVWIAIVLFLLSSICCLAQSNDEDAGGFVAGEYGAGGRTGSGGVYLGLYDTGGLQRLASPRHFLAPGFFLELGLAGATPKTPVDGLFSFNFQSTYNLHQDPTRSRRTPAFLFFNGGYSRFFVTGNAVNYGGGVMCASHKGTMSSEACASSIESLTCRVGDVSQLCAFHLNGQTSEMAQGCRRK